MKPEEDNVKPSIESPSTGRKFSRFTNSETKQNSEKPLRSSFRQRRVLTKSDNIASISLNSLNEEVVEETPQSQSENNKYENSKEEDKLRLNKYSSKYTRPNNVQKPSENKNLQEKPVTKEKNIYKTLNNLGLDPQTLETTEPVTERERFIPSSKRTKPYKQSTESVKEAQSSTFKPRYQLYQSKNRKNILDKRFGEGKENVEKLSIKEINESGNQIQIVILILPQRPVYV